MIRVGNVPFVKGPTIDTMPIAVARLVPRRRVARFGTLVALTGVLQRIFSVKVNLLLPVSAYPRSNNIQRSKKAVKSNILSAVFGHFDQVQNLMCGKVVVQSQVEAVLASTRMGNGLAVEVLVAYFGRALLEIAVN